jgi:hypothetical protein
VKKEGEEKKRMMLERDEVAANFSQYNISEEVVSNMTIYDAQSL